MYLIREENQECRPFLSWLLRQFGNKCIFHQLARLKIHHKRGGSADAKRNTPDTRHSPPRCREVSPVNTARPIQSSSCPLLPTSILPPAGEPSPAFPP